MFSMFQYLYTHSNQWKSTYTTRNRYRKKITRVARTDERKNVKEGKINCKQYSDIDTISIIWHSEHPKENDNNLTYDNCFTLSKYVPSK